MLKIKKSTIERIIREEFQAFAEAELKKSDDLEQEAVTADKENDSKPPASSNGNSVPKVGDEKKDSIPADASSPDEEVPLGDDPADKELSQDVEDPKAPKTGGKISDDVVGKRVQSLTLDPESKMMPGATEIVVQFESSPHPLRILISKSGMIKYFYKGSLRNSL